MTHKRNRTPPKLVSMMMIGFCLSLLVSLPVFAIPGTDLGNGKISLYGAQYDKCSHYHCHLVHTKIMDYCNAMNWGSKHAILIIDNRSACACRCPSTTPNQR